MTRAPSTERAREWGRRGGGDNLTTETCSFCGESFGHSYAKHIRHNCEVAR